jgi:hypothetical protein
MLPLEDIAIDINCFLLFYNSGQIIYAFPEIEDYEVPFLDQIAHTAFDGFGSIPLLEMPGAKRDDKMAVKGLRIYMSHPAAKRLAKVLVEYPINDKMLRV